MKHAQVTESCRVLHFSLLADMHSPSRANLYLNKSDNRSNHYRSRASMRWMLQLFLFFFLVAHVVADAGLPSGDYLRLQLTYTNVNHAGKSCFCKFHENVDECECSLESVDEYNNNYLYPLLQKLLKRDFFKYYKVRHAGRCLCLISSTCR